MKWKAHTRTAEKVLEVFGAMHFDKYEQDLINGIISPDNEDEKNHYIGREQTALDYLLRARKKRLEYDTAGCFFHLGVAFHYLQDMWTGVGPDCDDHKLYLDLINRCEILEIHESLERYYPVRRKRVLDQFRLLEKRLGKKVESQEDLIELVLMRRPYESTAFLDLNLSFRVCYRVAEMVLKTMYNVGLQESLERLNNDFVKRIKNGEIMAQKSLEEMEAKVRELALDDSAVSRLNRWNLEKKLESARQSYKTKKHLAQIVLDYETKVAKLCKPNESWYNIDKLKLNPEKILTPELRRAPQIKLEPIKVEDNVENMQISLKIS